MATDAARLIITKGLNCVETPPVQQSARITCTALTETHFDLMCFEFRNDRTGGGPYPYPAWNRLESGEAASFFREVKADDELIVPLDQEVEYFRKKNIVAINTKIGDRDFEKAYAVPKERAEIVVNLLNAMNATKNRAQFVVNKIKSRGSKATVDVKNVSIRRK